MMQCRCAPAASSLGERAARARETWRVTWHVTWRVTWQVTWRVTWRVTCFTARQITARFCSASNVSMIIRFDHFRSFDRFSGLTITAV